MENATIVKQGKGWQLTFENGRSMSVSWPDLPESLTGSTVKVKRVNGQPVEIVSETKTYKKPAPFVPNQQTVIDRRSAPNQGHGHNRQQEANTNRLERSAEGHRAPARAPYNFVPLNNKVVGAQELPGHDAYHFDRLSGFIDVDISALTDIFTRGEREENFTVNGRYALPGSSLRGLIRTMTEIAACSKMEFVDKERRLHFRNISDNHYKDIFLEATRDGHVYQKSTPGWLSKSGTKYYLQEAPTFYKVSRNILRKYQLDKESVYHHQDIWFDRSRVNEIHTKEVKNRTFYLHYNKVHSISKTQVSGLTKATLLITGLFGSSKHFQWIIPPPIPNAVQHDVSTIIADYEKDETRSEAANLVKALKELKASDGGSVPCFFITDDTQKPIAIGHTGIFRYPYKHNVGHAVRQDRFEDIDIAQAIFGHVATKQNGTTDSLVAGRVFFEDAFATAVTGTEFSALKILSSPKPTSFQLYLEQPVNRVHHWGTDDHNVRGRKFYWHKRESVWKNTDDLISKMSRQDLIKKALEAKETQYTVGEVLKAQSRFHGRIRFENLTAIELGALLFALDLPEDCAHKLGMGKPLGLGSVRVTPSLTLIHRRERYRNVFDENDNWLTGETREIDLQVYKDSFARYIGEQIEQPGIVDAQSYWTNETRMQELRHMLTFEHNSDGISWTNRTRYMEIEHPTNNNEYKNRPVLPKPSEVVNDETYEKN